MAATTSAGGRGYRLRPHFAPVDPLAPRRQDYLDNLKVCLTILVICHHSAIAFGAPGNWYFVIRPRVDSLGELAMTLFVGVNQAFFMTLFFAISAWLTPRSYDRKGAAAFLRDRLLRLGLPLVIFLIWLNPSLEWMAHRLDGVTDTSYQFFLWNYGARFLGAGPLWFVESLLIFALLYALIRALRTAPSPPQRPRPFPSHLAIFSFVFGMAVVAFLVRLFVPAGAVIFGLGLGEFPLYIAGYILGVKAWRYGWFEIIDRGRVRVWGGAAAVAIVLGPLAILFGADPEAGLAPLFGGLTSLSFLYALWQTLLCVGISMTLIWFFRENLMGTGPLPHGMAQSAYAAYIIHPFFVIAFTELVVQFPSTPLVHFMLLCPLAVIATFVSAFFLRRLPLLRQIL
ncbi:MAG: acyltransferase [Deltaproteobacteria bacterium]